MKTIGAKPYPTKKLNLEKNLPDLADHLETEFGTDIFERLIGESLTHNKQKVRLLDETVHPAEVYYKEDGAGKPYVQDYGQSRRWYPITAWREATGQSWKTCVQELAQIYLGEEGTTRQIPRRDQKPRPVPAPASHHDPANVARTLTKYEKNNFAFYLRRLLGKDVADAAMSRYNVGTSARWGGATVFWQQDVQGHYRAGKIILYNQFTGRRDKAIPPTWAHDVMGLEEFVLRQCFFGEHLLRTMPNALVRIVESEKTAIICSVLFPKFIWLATGGSNGLNADKWQVLRGRNVELWPDLDVKLDCYDLWEKKAKEMQREGISAVVNQLLRQGSTVANRQDKMDLADFVAGPDKRDPDTGRLIIDAPATVPATPRLNNTWLFDGRMIHGEVLTATDPPITPTGPPVIADSGVNTFSENSVKISDQPPVSENAYFARMITKHRSRYDLTYDRQMWQDYPRPPLVWCKICTGNLIERTVERFLPLPANV